MQVIRWGHGGISLIYSVNARMKDISLPAPAKPYRADGLWKATCFELFVAQEDGGYIEFNFSPSSEWAAYRFEEYRGEMLPLEMEESPLLEKPPSFWTEYGEGVIGFLLGVGVGSAPADLAFGLSAVIEEVDGRKSYWALNHPPGPPDFHHPACFTGRLPAVGKP